MRKSQKILILLIIITIVIILIITAMLLYSKTKNGDNNLNKVPVQDNYENYIKDPDNNSKIDDIPTEVEIVNKIEYVNDRTNYFSIQRLFNKYIYLLEEQNTQSLINILSPRYLEKYNVTSKNVVDVLSIPNISNESQYYKINMEEMLYVQIDESTYLYFVNGNCRLMNGEKKVKIKLMIEIDQRKSAYYIYPNEYLTDKGYDNLNVGDSINYQKEEITVNSNNKFTYVTKSDLDVVNEYFSNLKELLLYYPDEAYIRLDTQYAKKRFGSKEKFINYIEENKTTIALMSINKYKIVSKEEYVEYICSDKYDNIYILRQKDGIMNYTMFLDNYTIMHDEDIEYYNKLDKYDKATYNLRKFIEMVNTKDYNAIYSVLNNTFKSNNFSNVEQLKTYLKTNMYDINDIEIEVNDTSEYYIFNCIITNKRNESETKNMTIIIDQGEGTDFTMSFSFDS